MMRILFAFHEQNQTEPFAAIESPWPTAPPRLHEQITFSDTDDERINDEVFIVINVRYHVSREAVSATVKLWRAPWSERKALDEMQPARTE